MLRVCLIYFKNEIYVSCLKVTKMKQKYILFLSLCFVLFSCRKNDVGSVYSFDTVCKIVDYNLICSDENAPWGAIMNMEIVDSILILQHAMDEYAFSFINVNNGELLSQWGRTGEGPEEFIDFGSGFEIVDSRIVFLDRMKKERISVLISDILSKKEHPDITREAYPYNMDFRVLEINAVGNKKIVTGGFKEGYWGALDSQNHIIPNVVELPFDAGEVSGLEKGTVFGGILKANSKQSKFVLSIRASDVFEIYRVSDDGINRVYVSPFKHIPKTWKKGGGYAIDYNQSIGGIKNIAVSDDLICFSLFLQNYNEAAKTDFASNELFCFDWDGNKVKKYVLPFPIGNFCIDGTHIYGVRNFEDKIIIYRFNM